jgi:hypothetical protein
MKLIVFVAIGGVLSHSRGRLLGKPQNYVRAFQRLYRQYLIELARLPRASSLGSHNPEGFSSCSSPVAKSRSSVLPPSNPFWII